VASEDLSIYPGGDLVAKGLADLSRRVYSQEALLVLVAGPRLTGLGFSIPIPPEVPEPYEHALYSLIEAENPGGAHAAYNALIRRIVSFAQTCGARPRRSSRI